MKISRGVIARMREVFDVARALLREPLSDAAMDAIHDYRGPTLADIEEDRGALGTYDHDSRIADVHVTLVDDDGSADELPPPLTEGLAVLVDELRLEANAADERTAAVTRTNDQLRDERTELTRELAHSSLVLAAIRLDCGQLVRDAEARVAGGWTPESEGA